jgi:DNA-binding MarR family transcriptional regulator
MKTSEDASEAVIDTANQLHRSALRLLRLMQAACSTEGLSALKLSVLGRLYRQGTATPTALAAYLRIQPQSLTRLLADLQRRKLITRRPVETDRRQSLLEITAAGSELLIAEVRGQRTLLARTIARELTPTEQELLRIAAILMDRLAAVTEARAAAPG